METPCAGSLDDDALTVGVKREGRPGPRDRPGAVDERGGAIASDALDEPAHLPGREIQEDCRLIERQFAGQRVGEDGESSLRRSVQADRHSRVHGYESDKVAVPLTVTFSLSLNRLLPCS